MTSLGIHVVDAFIALAGRMTSVRASSKRIALPFGVDDATSVLIDFESGCTGYLGTVAATAHLYQVRAFGTEGWAQIHALDRLEADFRDGTREDQALGRLRLSRLSHDPRIAWRRSRPRRRAAPRFPSRPARSDMRWGRSKPSSGRPKRARPSPSDRAPRATRGTASTGRAHPIVRRGILAVVGRDPTYWAACRSGGTRPWCRRPGFSAARSQSGAPRRSSCSRGRRWPSRSFGNRPGPRRISPNIRSRSRRSCRAARRKTGYRRSTIRSSSLSPRRRTSRRPSRWSASGSATMPARTRCGS